MESARVSERIYPLGTAFYFSVCLYGDCFFTWVIVFLLLENIFVVDGVHCAIMQCSEKHKNCKTNKDEIYFT